MKPVLGFNSQSDCRNFRANLQAELNEVAKKFGLTAIQIEGGGKFTPTSMTVKITARTVEKQADPFFKKQQGIYLSQLSLPDNSIGRQFVSNGQKFQISHIDPKKWKSPVIAYLVQGGQVTDKGYKFQAERVKTLLLEQGA